MEGFGVLISLGTGFCFSIVIDRRVRHRNKGSMRCLATEVISWDWPQLILTKIDVVFLLQSGCLLGKILYN